MSARNRTRSINGPPGEFKSATGGVLKNNSYGFSGTMSDWNPGYPYSTMLMTKHEVQGGRMDGDFYWTKSNYIGRYTNYPCYASRSISHASVVLEGSYYPVNQAIANSHPGATPNEKGGTSATSVPNFIFELKDVPDMLKHAFGRAKALKNAAENNGKTDIIDHLKSPKSIAEDWLNYHFGWAPLVSDLHDIGGLADFAKKKLKFLRGHEGIITRRRDLGSKTGRGVITNEWYDDRGPKIFGTRTTIANESSWVVSKWRTSTPTLKAMEQNQLSALLSAGGFSNIASNFWNAIPWTWLSDWFVDVGATLDVYSNYFGVTFVNAQIMTHLERRSTVIPNPDQKFYVIPGCGQVTCISTSKRRDWYSPTIGFRPGTNLFGASHLATLASLAVTRGKGSSTF